MNGLVSLSILFFCNSAFSDWPPNSEIRVLLETTLFKEPKEDAKPIGKIPKGSTVRILGQREGNFLWVEIDLDSGALEGWVVESAVEKEKKPKEKPLPLSNASVPKDESVLLKRDPIFLYGFSLGGNMSIIQYPASTADYLGFGLMGSSYLGLYLSKNLPVRIEASLSQVNGTSEVDTINLGFNFFNISLIPTYQFNPFEAFLGVSYAIGLGVKDIPPSVQLPTARDLSNLWWLAGIGYKIDWGSVMTLVLRGGYSAPLTTLPFTFHVFGFQAALEFVG